MELTEFLLARIAEDEAVATAEAIARASSGTVALGAAYDHHPDPATVRELLQEAVIDGRRERPWSSPWSAARVLAECESKRRIVERCDTYYEDDLIAGDVLRLLGLPYVDHPDYRPAWKP